MHAELTTISWLETHTPLTLTELANCVHLSEEELQEWLDNSVVEVSACQTELQNDDSIPHFHGQTITLAQTARRLRKDFDLNTDGLVLAMRLLERIRELEIELQQTQARLPRNFS